MGRIIKFIILVMLIVVIGWVGLTVYSCFARRDIQQPDLPTMPAQEQAVYAVQIRNTGNLLLTNEYETLGSEVGKRTFVLHGYWEVKGQKFIYKPGEAVLDENIFGEIIIQRRAK